MTTKKEIESNDVKEEINPLVHISDWDARTDENHADIQTKNTETISEQPITPEVSIKTIEQPMGISSEQKTFTSPSHNRLSLDVSCFFWRMNKKLTLKKSFCFFK